VANLNILFGLKKDSAIESKDALVNAHDGPLSVGPDGSPYGMQFKPGAFPLRSRPWDYQIDREPREQCRTTFQRQSIFREVYDLASLAGFFHLRK
jgi:hypothetical protein